MDKSPIHNILLGVILDQRSLTVAIPPLEGILVSSGGDNFEGSAEEAVSFFKLGD
jgi:hypothetical protein